MKRPFAFAVTGVQVDATTELISCQEIHCAANR